MDKPEVEDLDRAVLAHLDVGWLEVAVDDAALVCGLERVGDLSSDGHRFRHRNRPSLQLLGKILAVDELHHERADDIRAFDAVDMSDVGMVQRGKRLRLTLEARQAVGVRGEELGNDLDRDVAVEPGIPGTVDFAHAAGADGGDDFIRAESGSGRQRHGLRGLLF